MWDSPRRISEPYLDIRAARDVNVFDKAHLPFCQIEQQRVGSHTVSKKANSLEQ
jgi:hypothetical protein